MSDMKRVDQIKDRVSIQQGLHDLGYRVSPVDREQQFACDLHGDGSDGKYSARVYPDSSSFYCFACGKSRDLIETYRDKFGLTFGKACYTIEAKYGLEHIFDTTKSDTTSEKVQVDNSEGTFNIQRRRMETILTNLNKVKPMKEALAWWEAYDLVCWRVENKTWSYEQGYRTLETMMARIKGKDNEKQGVEAS